MCSALLKTPPHNMSTFFYHASVQVLSCHARLAVPLPARDAARLARYLFTAGGCSSIDLHESIMAAVADLSLHDKPDSCAGQAAAVAAGVFDDVWQQHSVLPGAPATLEQVGGVPNKNIIFVQYHGTAFMVAMWCSRTLSVCVVVNVVAVGMRPHLSHQCEDAFCLA